MLPKLWIISTIVPIFYGQLYYPDDTISGGILSSPLLAKESSSSFVIPKNLTEIRGTTLYEQYVDKIISKGILKLTLAIDQAILSTSKGNYDNVVYAPVSIAAALALVLMGSNGKTFEEISTIMGLASGIDIHNKSQVVHEQFGRMLTHLQATSGFNFQNQVNFASAIFVQDNYPIRSVYKQSADWFYESEILNLNFEKNSEHARQIINAWVSDRTKGKINTLLNESPSPATKVIIASAMYFKAEWEKPFFDGTTRRRPFYTNGRQSKSDAMVEMMSNGGSFPYYKDRQLNCEIMGFPYKGNQTTMYVIVPNNSNRDKLKEFSTQLTPTELQRLVDNVQETDAVVLFPKMKIDSTIDLKRSLQMLGVKSLFDPLESNLALLSPGVADVVNYNSADDGKIIKNPISANSFSENGESVLIFSRMGAPVNCTQIFNPNSNVNTCEEILSANNRQQRVYYKKFDNKVGRRVISNRSAFASQADSSNMQSLDSIRQYLNRQINSSKFENPGLYADQVIHKVFMEITESGTEAAAATAVSLSRGGGRVTFRVDVPFLFLIQHEQTKTVLFWGSVNTPTPSYN